MKKNKKPPQTPDFVFVQAKVEVGTKIKLIIPPCEYPVQIEIPESAFEHVTITVLRNGK